MQDYLDILAGGASAIIVWIGARIIIANYKRNKEIKREMAERKEKEEARRERKSQRKKGRD